MARCFALVWFICTAGSSVPVNHCICVAVKGNFACEKKKFPFHYFHLVTAKNIACSFAFPRLSCNATFWQREVNIIVLVPGLRAALHVFRWSLVSGVCCSRQLCPWVVHHWWIWEWSLHHQPGQLRFTDGLQRTKTTSVRLLCSGMDPGFCYRGLEFRSAKGMRLGKITNWITLWIGVNGAQASICF